MSLIKYEKYRISFCIFWLTSALFTGLAIHDYLLRPSISSAENGFISHTVGPTGFEIAQCLILGLGYGAVSIPVLFVFFAFVNGLNKKVDLTTASFMLGVFITALAIINMMIPIRTEAPVFTAGGYLGVVINDFMFYYFDYTGTLLLLSSALLLAVHALFSDTINRLCGSLASAFTKIWTEALKSIRTEESQTEANCEPITLVKDRNVSNIVIPSINKQKSVSKNISKERQAPILPTMNHLVTERMPSAQGQDVKTQSQVKPVRKSNEVNHIAQSSHGKIQTNIDANVVPVKIVMKDPKAPPPLELLNQDKLSEKVKEDPRKLQLLAEAIEHKLKDFGVEAQVMNILLGPIITRFEIQPAPGTKASKVTNLAKDLARSLSVSSVRVVEVITGKTFIGIEIPNKKRVTVSLKTIFESDAFQESKSALCLALGVDISGDSVVVDLAKMPHLLVAGTTGSGKSVGLNTMLLSLLYKTTAADLRLILIDPKMLEFAVYEGIPHLLTPVVTDMNDASYALSWCVDEMERRYRLMAELGVRNINGYNEKVKIMPNVETGSCGDDQPVHTHLPHIVVIADEFADMMMMVGKKVEQLIARLAQKARAAGIHLILATQRPSVDVITGLIKANIPTRISFQVSSKIDSRTIIDQQGAESLLGSGDMLYLSPGAGVPIRCHGAYVSDEAIAGVVEHLRSTGKPEHIEIKKEPVAATSQSETISHTEQKKNKDDTLYDQIVDFVTTSRKVSTSSVQRRFRIGYNRASVMVERMESEGVVSGMDDNGQRKVIAPPPVTPTDL